MEKALKDAYDYIRRLYQGEPEVGIILGTGLGKLADQIEVEKMIPYNFIPNFPISTVQSHFGRLIFGKIDGKQVMAMQGRFHYYEGYSMQQITFPVRLMKLLGVHTLFVSNASGALNLDYQNGDLVVIDDHINLQSTNPLIGPNLDEFGPRFPSMARPYDPALVDRALALGKEWGFRVQKGIYVAVTGPNLETRAEYRYMRIIGGDIVGMSTVPEVLVARHMNMRVFAMSVVTDIGDPEDLEIVTLDDMISVANEAEPRLTRIICQLIEELA